MPLINLNEKFQEIKNSVALVDFTDIELPSDFKAEYKKYLSENRADGYHSVVWSKHSSKITTSTGKDIYLTNFWFYIASQLSEYLDGLKEHKELFKLIFAGEDLQHSALSLRSGVSEADQSRIKDFFNQHDFGEDDYQHFIAFVSDYPSWGGGKTIDRNDFFVSPLLQAGGLLAETQSAIAEIAKQFSESSALKRSFKPIFLKSSNRPEVSLVSNRNVNSFVFSVINYLIDHDKIQPLVDCLVAGSTDLGNYNIEFNSIRLTSMFKISDSVLAEDSLIRGGVLRYFSSPFQYGGRFYYLSNQWTDGTDSRLDLQNLISIFHDLYDDMRIIKIGRSYHLSGSFTKSKSDVKRVAKPFILLAGISGTGKTRFVRKQAENGDSEKCYELVSVRPDWHEPSDLLGYISRLSGTPQYVVTDVLRFVALAWRKIVDGGLDLSVVPSNGHEQIAVTGKSSSLESLGPQWLCLDEMNLAPVEQYFADYLSILETREWKWDGDSFTYKSDALLKPGIFKELSPGSLSILKNDLGFSEAYSDLWDFVTTHGLGVPPQLIVAGTVNMDETTHGFSRKVIDRALTFDFGEFYPNVLSEIFEPTTTNKTLSYPIHSQAQREYLPAVDSDGALSIEFIEKINAVLDNTPFKLAYRAMNELLLSVICYQPSNQLELKAVWDDFLMCKVLPRIEGDTDKLAGKGNQQQSLLDELEDLLSSEFNEFWNASGADEFARPDLLRVSNDCNRPVIRIGCRSRKKLEWMQGRLTTSGFTSFWP